MTTAMMFIVLSGSMLFLLSCVGIANFRASVNQSSRHSSSTGAAGTQTGSYSIHDLRD
jgi:hypothetical protein